MTENQIDHFPLPKEYINRENSKEINIINEDLTNINSSKITLKELKCKKCRRNIISSEDIISHEIGPGQIAFSYKKRGKSSEDIKKQCSSYFIEPKTWIFDKSSSDDGGDDDETSRESELLGKINCPKCNSKLGNYNWSGMQCSCGSWVTPAFAIHNERVDEVLTTTTMTTTLHS